MDQLASIDSVPDPPGLHDTLSPRVAAEWTGAGGAFGHTVGRLGYAYEPSPGTPRADPMLFTNPRHVVTFGFGTGGSVAVDEAPVALRVELFFQAHLLESQRRARPAPIDDPSAAPLEVTGGGWVGVGGVFLEVAF